ncbi:MAG: dTMP kinase [Deltaproteobacteria bacterium]|jgi:dTMP kinase|nr:dTMP kinase [Deltaproteobacteria bacterium]
MFITFEGIEGSGKSAMLELCRALLASLGRRTLQTREPGGSPLGVRLRELLLNVENSRIIPEAELFLYLADRAQHVREVIRPALETGLDVLSDRYADSTVVYQGYGRGLDIENLFQLNDLAVQGLWPDLTLVLDLEVETGLQRAIKRNRAQGLTEKEGRFEAEALDFHAKIRAGYRAWTERHPGRIKLVDATGSREEVFARIEPWLRGLMAGCP